MILKCVLHTMHCKIHTMHCLHVLLHTHPPSISIHMVTCCQLFIRRLWRLGFNLPGLVLLAGFLVLDRELSLLLLVVVAFGGYQYLSRYHAASLGNGFGYNQVGFHLGLSLSRVGARGVSQGWLVIQS